MSMIVLDTTIQEVLDVEIAKRVTEVLMKHYPGYLWAANARGGIVDVILMDSMSNWGFTIKHLKSYSASALDREVVMLGGELLERYRLKRGAADHDQIASSPVDIAGRMRPEM